VIVAGIDEAGYGPLLGPLVVACVSVESAWPIRPNALRRLRGWTIQDSKRFAPGPGRMAALARNALPFLGGPRRWSELLERAVLDPGTVRSRPWYGPDEPLPEAPDPPGGGRWRARVAIVEPDAINAPRKKSETLFGATARLIGELPGGARVFADAQGMRRSYRPLLERYFGSARVLCHRKGLWRYRAGGRWIQFRVRGESAHDLMAAASIVAKYVRELCMGRVSAFWRRRRGLELPLWRASGYRDPATRRFAAEVILPALEGVSVDEVIRRK
jgi:ribonuclease HII